MLRSTPAKVNPAVSTGLDLKRSLTIHVLVVTLVCFLTATALAVGATVWDLIETNAKAAQTIGRVLELQLFRIENSMDLKQRFPDWEPVVEHVLTQGQCVRYLNQDGAVDRAECVGTNDEAPLWFPARAQRALAARTVASYELSWHDRTHGRVVVSTEPSTLATAAASRVTPMLSLAALMAGAICVLLYVAIDRALKPTRQVLEGLDRLAQGDLTCRLPGFRLRELHRISEVFNAMAANIQTATQERQALAARLVDAAELERRRIARDLHDELAQNLAAMSVGAASIKATADRGCPRLSEEAAQLQASATAVMKSLRATLRDLRPQEIDDLGLRAGLAALAATSERLSNGTLAITLETSGTLDELPPATSAHVYRIVQEGLANVVKHAGASRCSVTLRLAPSRSRASAPWQLELVIEDDGRGLSASNETGGLGLVGMRERVMALGGTLCLDTQPAMGVRLRVQIPVNSYRQETAA